MVFLSTVTLIPETSQTSLLILVKTPENRKFDPIPSVWPRLVAKKIPPSAIPPRTCALSPTLSPASIVVKLLTCTTWLEMVQAVSPIDSTLPVSYTHLRAHETDSYLV